LPFSPAPRYETPSSCATAGALLHLGIAIEEDVAVYVRVVRFTGVSAERIDGLVARIEEADAPPSGVRTTGLKMLFDQAQETAVVLQYFETTEDMEAGARAFSAMDASETPGTRASVDMCELKLERTLA
jgi:hypothetical protein